MAKDAGGLTLHDRTIPLGKTKSIAHILDTMQTAIEAGSFTSGISVAGSSTMTFVGTENLNIVNTTLGSGTKGVLIEMEAGSLIAGSRQGAMHIELGRNGVMTASDGNPDCALKVTSNDWSDGGSGYARIRGLDLKAQNDGENGNSTVTINAAYITAECATGMANSGDMSVGEFHLKNNGTITGANIGVKIQDQSQGSAGSTLGLEIMTSAYDLARDAAISIGSSAGSWITALSLNNTMTYFADFDGCTGTNATITSDSGSAATTWKARIKVKTDDGTDGWINVYSTSNES